MKQDRQRIAVIGAGISGLASAYLLSRKHDVVLFESGAYLGGHANTVDVTLDGMTCPVDTGFLVYNRATYPHFISLLQELDVQSVSTNMSFSVSLEGGKLEWAGTNLNTVFAQRKNLLSPPFIAMLRDILHFNATANDNLHRTSQNGATLGELLDGAGKQRRAYGNMFRHAYLLPMAAAIWSSSPEDILNFPACTFLRFCLNHALLQVSNRPQWQTVTGGSREYVRKIAATLSDVRLNSPVQSVIRSADGVNVTSMTHDGRQRLSSLFDSVVFATHAPQTLALLGDASVEERSVLAAVRYQTNHAFLHTDKQQMPRNSRVWSAWNYLGASRSGASHPLTITDHTKALVREQHHAHQSTQEDTAPVCVSYWLNRLQNLPFRTPLMVTLNPFTPPAPEQVFGQFEYEHPIMDYATISAQKQLPDIQGKNRIWFTGAWTGYGFHEDGLTSALRVAADFDVAPAWMQ